MRHNRQDILKTLVDFFIAEGKIYKRSEYYKLKAMAPVEIKKFSRYFNGRSYHTVIKMASKAYPVEWASIGSKKVEEPIPTPKKPTTLKKKVETAKEETLSPIEKLRVSKGESSE